MLDYAIVCPLVFLAGFVDSIAGGGGLISLPAYLMTGLPPVGAIATNKFSSFCGTLVPTWRYARRGMFDVVRSIPAIVAALGGSAVGAELALKVPGGVFDKVMLVVIPLTAVFVLSVKGIESRKKPFSAAATMWIAAAAALVMGVYDGFYGPGTGTFLILALVYIARCSLNSAAGMSKMINLSTNAAALAVYLYHGAVALPLGIAAAVFGIAGNYLGSTFFIRKGSGIAKPVIIAVLTIFLIKMIFFQ